MRLGADIESLADFGTSLQSAASRLDSLVQEIDGSVASLWWHGDAARSLSAGWRQADRPAMCLVAEDLGTASAVVRRNVEQQQRASDGSSVAAGAAGPGLLPRESTANREDPFTENARDPLLNVIGVLSLAGDVVPVSKAMYYGMMVGGPLSLTNVGMHLSKGSAEAHRYFAGAKGGFTTALRAQPTVNIRAGVFGLALEGTLMIDTAVRHGTGSSEFVAQAVDGGLSSAAGFVPGGGLAYLAGKQAGEWIYHETPTGEWMESRHGAARHIDAVESTMSDSDAAMSRGDFEEANRLNERAREQSQRAMEESSGWKGLWNSIPI